jgi:hypothetical protein
MQSKGVESEFAHQVLNMKRRCRVGFAIALLTAWHRAKYFSCGNGDLTQWRLTHLQEFDTTEFILNGLQFGNDFLGIFHRH